MITRSRSNSAWFEFFEGRKSNEKLFSSQTTHSLFFFFLSVFSLYYYSLQSLILSLEILFTHRHMNSSSSNPYLPLIITSTPFLNSTSTFSSNSTSIQLLKSSSYLITSLLILLPFIFYQRFKLLQFWFTKKNESRKKNEINSNSKEKEFGIIILFISTWMIGITKDIIQPIVTVKSPSLWLAERYSILLAFLFCELNFERLSREGLKLIKFIFLFDGDT